MRFVLKTLTLTDPLLCRSANMTAHRAEAFAEVLLSKPGPWQGMGHLRHMPSHIFQRIGRYHDGVVSNQQAFEADKLDSDNCRVPYGAGVKYCPRIRT